MSSYCLFALQGSIISYYGVILVIHFTRTVNLGLNHTFQYVIDNLDHLCKGTGQLNERDKFTMIMLYTKFSRTKVNTSGMWAFWKHY